MVLTNGKAYRQFQSKERIAARPLESRFCCVELLMRQSRWTPSVVPANEPTVYLAGSEATLRPVNDFVLPLALRGRLVTLN